MDTEEKLRKRIKENARMSGELAHLYKLMSAFSRTAEKLQQRGEKLSQKFMDIGITNFANSEWGRSFVIVGEIQQKLVRAHDGWIEALKISCSNLKQDDEKTLSQDVEKIKKRLVGPNKLEQLEKMEARACSQFMDNWVLAMCMQPNCCDSTFLSDKLDKIKRNVSTEDITIKPSVLPGAQQETNIPPPVRYQPAPSSSPLAHHSITPHPSASPPGPAHTIVKDDKSKTLRSFFSKIKAANNTQGQLTASPVSPRMRSLQQPLQQSPPTATPPNKDENPTFDPVRAASMPNVIGDMSPISVVNINTGIKYNSLNKRHSAGPYLLSNDPALLEETLNNKLRKFSLTVGNGSPGLLSDMPKRNFGGI